jgi:hypothetical protein
MQKYDVSVIGMENHPACESHGGNEAKEMVKADQSPTPAKQRERLPNDIYS